MENMIAIIAVVVVLALAIRYIYKAKKSGAKCIGCPDSGTCSAKSCSSCSCGCGGETK